MKTHTRTTTGLPTTLALFFVAAMLSCSPAKALPPSEPSSPKAGSPPKVKPDAKKKLPPLPEFIGEATMEKDGTIKVNITAKECQPDRSIFGCVLGITYFIYRVGQPDYDKVLKHLGGMKPGEKKPVRPWPGSE